MPHVTSFNFFREIWLIKVIFLAATAVTPTQYPQPVQEEVNLLNCILAILMLEDQTDPNVIAAIADINIAIIFLSKN